MLLKVFGSNTKTSAKKQVKLILVIQFLTQHYQNIIISTCNYYKTLLMRYFLFFWWKSLKSKLYFTSTTHLISDWSHVASGYQTEYQW